MKSDQMDSMSGISKINLTFPTRQIFHTTNQSRTSEMNLETEQEEGIQTKKIMGILLDFPTETEDNENYSSTKN